MSTTTYLSRRSSTNDSHYLNYDFSGCGSEKEFSKPIKIGIRVDVAYRPRRNLSFGAEQTQVNCFPWRLTGLEPQRTMAWFVGGMQFSRLSAAAHRRQPTIQLDNQCRTRTSICTTLFGIFKFKTRVATVRGKQDISWVRKGQVVSE